MKELADTRNLARERQQKISELNAVSLGTRIRFQIEFSKSCCLYKISELNPVSHVAHARSQNSV